MPAKRVLSTSAREAIAEAQRKHWAKVRRQKKQAERATLVKRSLNMGIYMTPLTQRCRSNFQNQPEIHDPRLCAWLEFKYPYEKLDRPPAFLTMILAENNSYRMEPMSLDAHTRAIYASGNYRQVDIIEGLPAQLPQVSIPPSLGFRAMLL
jgi:hypothetical protein